MEGYAVFAVKNGLEALEVFMDERIDIVVSDIVIPEMDGLTLTKEIKGIDPGIPVILTTAYGDVASYLEAMDLGVYEYLNKPLNIELFLDYIERAIYQNENAPFSPKLCVNA